MKNKKEKINEIEKKDELKAISKIKTFWQWLAFIFVTDKKDNSTVFWKILFFISFCGNVAFTARFTNIFSTIFDFIISIIKKAAASLFLILLISGCSMSKPKLKDYDGFSDIEKKIQFEIDLCYYAQQHNKKDLRCDQLRTDNVTIKNILNYNILKKNNMIPKIYRKSGGEEMTFDDLFRK